MNPSQHHEDLIGRFARHPVACNLLMLLMVISGLMALSKLNTQLFPTFSINYVRVSIPWRGATAEDAESAIANVLEERLRTISGARHVNSVSMQGLAELWVRFEQGTDMNAAADEVSQVVATTRNLPASAEDPQIVIMDRLDVIARIVVSGPPTRAELRPIVKRMEADLLALGIARINITGLPEEEIAIQFTPSQIHELGQSLPDIARTIAARSLDAPAGDLGNDEVSRELRSVEQRRSELGFQRLPLITDQQGRLLSIGDVARVSRRPREDARKVQVAGRPAVELELRRGLDDDALTSGRQVNDWLDELRPRLPPGIEVQIFDERWQPIRDRIVLLLENGLSGLALVIGILYLFLNGRVAFWVTVGIPVSFLATLAVLQLTGGSINMISSFALIMALGIIVDDAIVVGEDALAHYQTGEDPLQAAEGGARRMFWPVLCSSLTTVAAFVPLMLIGDYIGAILSAIPVVIICVILASLIESFLILPGHLRGSFHKMHHAEPSPLRAALDTRFNRFRDTLFRPLITGALENRRIVLAVGLAALLISFGLVGGGRVGFVFFPTPEGNSLIANVGFATGTRPTELRAFLDHLQATLEETDAELGPGLVRIAVDREGIAVQPGTNFTRTGQQYGHIQIELSPSDERRIRNDEFVSNWQQRIVRPAALDSLAIFEPNWGPPGQDLEIRISGTDAFQIKRAAEELAQILSGIPGVSAVSDDTPYGREQIIYQLNPNGQALGLTASSIGAQLRAAFDGELVQIFQDRGDEIEVRVSLTDEARDSLRGLETLPIILPGGGSAPLGNLVELTTARGFERLRHADGKLAIKVTGDVIESMANANAIRAELAADVLPALAARHPVQFAFTGQAEDQAETLADMQRGLLLALTLIYVVLAWVFGSYGWPLVVMSIIPFGIVGALIGHWAMGIDLTLLSLFGLFGLSGIVVNDSIILVVFYRDLIATGMPWRTALVEASCRRLRAVLLTSLTTIAGLTPLMFESSLQAQFLIPMATSITFGLAFSTGVVLILVPTLLSLWEEFVAHTQDTPAPVPVGSSSS